MITKELQNKIFSGEYKKKLEQSALNIRRASEIAENEATVVSAFEINLYSFINDNLGMKFLPEKEKAVNTERHITKGRIDSKYGAFIIEFKHPNQLATGKQKEKATEQLKDYLQGLYQDTAIDYLGLVTDGVSCKFVRSESGDLFEESWKNIDSSHLDRIVKVLILLEQVALTSENLIKDFCEPLDDNLTKGLASTFYKILSEKMEPKTQMLFEEWQELFRLSHDDTSKQRDIQDRRKELSNALSLDIKNNEQEYMALYSLQTTYAIIVKLIAFKVISQIHFGESFIEFRTLAEAESSVLRLKLAALEDGEIFRQIGINNLLEGDFFSWYASPQQWNKEIFKIISDVLQILSKYEDKVLVYEQTKTNDLFKELYQRIIPPKVRHSLGEFYTPAWLADNLILEGLKIINYRNGWKMLDPTAGSGTFLVVGIQKILEEQQEDWERISKLKDVLDRVKGFDLNPLSVLTARVNYFVNVAHLLGTETTEHIHIPIYLGDSSYVPESVTIDNIDCLTYKIKTLKGYIDVTLPKDMIVNSEKFSETMIELEYDIKSLDWKTVSSRIKEIASRDQLTENIEEKIDTLAKKFVELEQNEWNGIWARIVTNFLTTASIGKFDLIVGNPPWVDWKNLPGGYRERIKERIYPLYIRV